MDATHKRSWPRSMRFPFQAIRDCSSEGEDIESALFQGSRGMKRKHRSSGDTSTLGSAMSSDQSSRQLSSEDLNTAETGGHRIVRRARMPTNRMGAYEDNPVGEGCSSWFSLETSGVSGIGDQFSEEERFALKAKLRASQRCSNKTDGAQVNPEEATVYEISGVCFPSGKRLFKRGIRAVAKLREGGFTPEIPTIGFLKSTVQVPRDTGGMILCCMCGRRLAKFRGAFIECRKPEEKLSCRMVHGSMVHPVPLLLVLFSNRDTTSASETMMSGAAASSTWAGLFQP